MSNLSPLFAHTHKHIHWNRLLYSFTAATADDDLPICNLLNYIFSGTTHTHTPKTKENISWSTILWGLMAIIQIKFRWCWKHVEPTQKHSQNLMMPMHILLLSMYLCVMHSFFFSALIICQMQHCGCFCCSSMVLKLNRQTLNIEISFSEIMQYFATRFSLLLIIVTVSVIVPISYGFRFDDV